MEVALFITFYCRAVVVPLPLVVFFLLLLGVLALAVYDPLPLVECRTIFQRMAFRSRITSAILGWVSLRSSKLATLYIVQS